MLFRSPLPPKPLQTPPTGKSPKLWLAETMDGDRRLPPAATLASAAAVLGNNDLLREILLRLGFPTCLVHAALVSKRWLHHASNPAFLRHFRERNPPRVLGVFACYPGTPYKFLPLLQPPELAALSRRAASSFDGAFTANTYQRVVHCRNSRLITVFLHEGTYRHSLLEPLLAGESEAVLPQTPLPRHLPQAGSYTRGILSDFPARGWGPRRHHLGESVEGLERSPCGSVRAGIWRMGRPYHRRDRGRSPVC